MENTVFANNLGKKIVDATNEFGVRSKKRTDKFHQAVAELITSINPKLTCKIEYSLEISSGTHAVDISVFQDDDLCLLISFKAHMNNIKQNYTNSQNAKGGEALKMVNGAPNAKVVFLDVLPITCPYYLNCGTHDGTEQFNPDSIRVKNEQLMEVLTPRGVKTCDGIFTIFMKYEYPSIRGDTINFVEAVEYSDLDKFIEIIKSL